VAAQGDVCHSYIHIIGTRERRKVVTHQEYAWRSGREEAQDQEREKLAAWMVSNGFAIGHGESLESLLQELAWQIEELRQKLQYAQQQAS
jgi:hypothetical protein